ncbi:MAG: HD domain-containing protein [Clostridia bacterium]|nr:HD domain-containing protein [Clostridia bacterium]
MEIDKCIEYMKNKHNGQKRKHGTPYYEHPLSVSNILKEKGFSKEYQIVGLFHDLLEDTNTTYEEILEITNKEIADAVKLLTKETGYNMKEYISKIKENNIARMVKLADRIHNLSEAHLASYEFQQRYIKETEEWFIDLAKDTIFEEDLCNILYKLKNKSRKEN